MAATASHLALQRALRSSGDIISASLADQKPEKTLTNVPVAYLRGCPFAFRPPAPDVVLWTGRGWDWGCNKFTLTQGTGHASDRWRDRNQSASGTTSATYAATPPSAAAAKSAGLARGGPPRVLQKSLPSSE